MCIVTAGLCTCTHVVTALGRHVSSAATHRERQGVALGLPAPGPERSLRWGLPGGCRCRAWTQGPRGAAGRPPQPSRCALGWSGRDRLAPSARCCGRPGCRRSLQVATEVEVGVRTPGVKLECRLPSNRQRPGRQWRQAHQAAPPGAVAAHWRQRCARGRHLQGRRCPTRNRPSLPLLPPPLLRCPAPALRGSSALGVRPSPPWAAWQGAPLPPGAAPRPRARWGPRRPGRPAACVFAPWCGYRSFKATSRRPGLNPAPPRQPQLVDRVVLVAV